MSNFFTNLVTRNLGSRPDFLQPRLPALFETPTLGAEATLSETTRERDDSYSSSSTATIQTPPPAGEVSVARDPPPTLHSQRTRRELTNPADTEPDSVPTHSFESPLSVPQVAVVEPLRPAERTRRELTNPADTEPDSVPTHSFESPLSVPQVAVVGPLRPAAQPAAARPIDAETELPSTIIENLPGNRTPIVPEPVLDEVQTVLVTRRQFDDGHSAEDTTGDKPEASSQNYRRVEPHVAPNVREGIKPRPEYRPDATLAMNPISDPAPSIHISIGRIEVRAVTSAATPIPSAAPARSKHVTLDDYLRQRNEGKR